jgi:hypothetical protein
MLLKMHQCIKLLKQETKEIPRIMLSDASEGRIAASSDDAVFESSVCGSMSTVGMSSKHINNPILAARP